MELPPPWIQTITGRRASPVGKALGEKGGAKTFSVRQSSLPAISPGSPSTPAKGLAYCMQGAPKERADCVPVHGARGSGARQRRSPTGGFAYGMPSHAWAP